MFAPHVKISGRHAAMILIGSARYCGRVRRRIVRWLSPKPNYPDGILGGRAAGTIVRNAKFGAMV